MEGYKDACEKERSSTDSQRDTHPFVSENERSGQEELRSRNCDTDLNDVSNHLVDAS